MRSDTQTWHRKSGICDLPSAVERVIFHSYVTRRCRNWDSAKGHEITSQTFKQLMRGLHQPHLFKDLLVSSHSESSCFVRDYEKYSQFMGSDKPSPNHVVQPVTTMSWRRPFMPSTFNCSSAIGHDVLVATLAHVPRWKTHRWTLI